MHFMARFLHGVAMLPSVVQGMETVYGQGTGAQKRAMAMSVAVNAIEPSNAIDDPQRFAEGLGMVVDGVVTCLNASLWTKRD
jgi:hypothetical protein